MTRHDYTALSQSYADAHAVAPRQARRAVWRLLLARYGCRWCIVNAGWLRVAVEAMGEIQA
jgi:hypothetical protein